MCFQVWKNLAIDELDQCCFRRRIAGRRRGLRGRGGWFGGSGFCCGGRRRFRRRWWRGRRCWRRWRRGFFRRWGCRRDRWSRSGFVSRGNGSACDGFARRFALHSRRGRADRFRFRRGRCGCRIRGGWNRRLNELRGFRCGSRGGYRRGGGDRRGGGCRTRGRFRPRHWSAHASLCRSHHRRSCRHGFACARRRCAGVRFLRRSGLE